MINIILYLFFKLDPSCNQFNLVLVKETKEKIFNKNQKNCYLT